MGPKSIGALEELQNGDQGLVLPHQLYYYQGRAMPNQLYGENIFSKNLISCVLN